MRELVLRIPLFWPRATLQVLPACASMFQSPEAVGLYGCKNFHSSRIPLGRNYPLLAPRCIREHGSYLRINIVQIVTRMIDATLNQTAMAFQAMIVSRRLWALQRNL
jgi:hypothetical protein